MIENLNTGPSHTTRSPLKSNVSYFVLWLAGLFVSVLMATSLSVNLIYLFSVPLVVCFLITWLSDRFSINGSILLSYVLFFSISITFALGLTGPLTGVETSEQSQILFGLSFYTVSLAFLLYKNSRLTSGDALRVSNPLLLSTGPVALFVKSCAHMSLRKRLNYYLPYIIVGYFFFRIIGTPLTETYGLIEKTDVVSSLLFAVIFEIFIYANFCGLSLMVFGFFGVLGYKIPLNFRQPFSSSNIRDFWRGWHTSLSAVLRVMFYVPLRKKAGLSAAIFGVYFASAIWHGITFNFILWGLFHAVMFLLTLYLLRKNIRVLPVIVMIIAIIGGRLIFADSNTDRLIEKLSFQYGGLESIKFLLGVSNPAKLALCLGFGLIFYEFIFRNYKIVSKRNYKFLRAPFMLMFITIITLALLSDGEGAFAVYGQR